MSSIALRLGRRVLLSSRHARSFANSNADAGFSYPGARSLEQIVKMELLESEQAPKIRSIWEEFHADKDDAVATTLDVSEFQALVKRAEAAPYFIFPVYRQEGFFNMLCQFQQSCFLITYLEAFKENPAPRHPALPSHSSYQDDQLYEHVDMFNNKPDQFDFEAYRVMLQNTTEA
ncbi:hypothetical protein AM588_10002797 [Phytophthora nicotianae]|uniref:Uncharacterized protein n=1 Tax=Phytophthora nicotianae TaxID=4792 RepID=A0A0W8CVJ7_PHYNI|nr:hypothetical protein AM588_10002797 [Phytophthora nicotianae]